MVFGCSGISTLDLGLSTLDIRTEEQRSDSNQPQPARKPEEFAGIDCLIEVGEEDKQSACEGACGEQSASQGRKTEDGGRKTRFDCRVLSASKRRCPGLLAP